MEGQGLQEIVMVPTPIPPTFSWDSFSSGSFLLLKVGIFFLPVSPLECKPHDRRILSVLLSAVPLEPGA